jgi:hypothetical protein
MRILEVLNLYNQFLCRLWALFAWYSCRMPVSCTSRWTVLTCPCALSWATDPISHDQSSWLIHVHFFIIFPLVLNEVSWNAAYIYACEGRAGAACQNMATKLHRLPMRYDSRISQKFPSLNLDWAFSWFLAHNKRTKHLNQPTNILSLQNAMNLENNHRRSPSISWGLEVNYQNVSVVYCVAFGI